jgi:hypothetical protein
MPRRHAIADAGRERSGQVESVDLARAHHVTAMERYTAALLELERAVGDLDASLDDDRALGNGALNKRVNQARARAHQASQAAAEAERVASSADAALLTAKEQRHVGALLRATRVLVGATVVLVVATVALVVVTWYR